MIQQTANCQIYLEPGDSKIILIKIAEGDSCKKIAERQEKAINLLLEESSELRLANESNYKAAQGYKKAYDLELEASKAYLEVIKNDKKSIRRLKFQRILLPIFVGAIIIVAK